MVGVNTTGQSDNLPEEIKQKASERAFERAQTGKWDLNIAVYLSVVLFVVIILSFNGVDMMIVAPIALVGLAIVWIIGWRQGKQLFKRYFEEETRNELQKMHEITELDKRIEFTRTLVHELKTPLVPLIASSELMLDQVPEGQMRRLAETINRGAETLLRRIDMLMDSAKSELGILELKRERTDLIRLVQNIVDETRPLLNKREQILKVEIPENLPEMLIDDERVREVIVNLLDNSSKFTPENGEITIRLKEDTDKVIIEVEDTGIGIPADQQPYLFQAYTSIATGDAQRKGLGLGLSLARVFVELHGGNIWAESREGEGSKFSFSLPNIRELT